MALSEEDKARVRADYLRWSGGDGPDVSEEPHSVYLEHAMPADLDEGDVEEFLDAWMAELEAALQAAIQAANKDRQDPVLWEGEAEGGTFRVRRLDATTVIAEQAADGVWEATDDETAAAVYEMAIISLVGTRGLPE